MTVYVDEFKHYGPTRIPCFKAGSSHMMADTLEELHVMALAIGLRPAWFQGHASTPHYDLTESKRTKALKLGAVFVPARVQARQRVAARHGVRLSIGDACEVEKFGDFLKRRAEKPDEPAFMTYAETYGVVVYKSEGT